MRNLIVPTALVLGLALSGPSFAATKAPAMAKPAATSTKAADCLKQWKAQKKHTETKKAFLAACEK